MKRAVLILFAALLSHATITIGQSPNENDLPGKAQRTPKTQETQRAQRTPEAQSEKESRANRDAQRLAEFLRRFPKSDLNQDGRLTREEVRQFNARRRREGTARAESNSKKATTNRDAQRKGGPIPPTHANVAYGSHRLQAFDLWLAPNSSGKPTPLAIYIHGGGFRGGSRRSINPSSIRRFHDAGVSVASIDYRLSDVGPYPIMMHDAARCLQTIRSRASEWNLDKQRIACYGGSAGAGISLWLAFHDDLAQPDSDDPIARESTRIVAAATSNGQSTYDMHTFRKWFGVPDLAIHEAIYPLFDIKNEADLETPRVKKLMYDASPINHLTSDDVPVYMTYRTGNVPVTAKTEPGVWVHHVLLGLKLQQKMRSLGIECIVTSPDHADTKYGSIEKFLIAKLNAGTNKSK